MPMKLNVGASRKVTDNNYGSRGASINLEMELDTALVAEPAKLQEKIRSLFGVAREALSEELNGGGHHQANGHVTMATNGSHVPTNRLPGSNGNGRYASPQDAEPRRATPSQCKALHAIARANGVVLRDYLRENFKAGRPDDLDIKQASRAIDDLKSSQVGAASGS